MKDDDNIWNDDDEKLANRPWKGCEFVAVGIMVLALVLAMMELFK